MKELDYYWVLASSNRFKERALKNRRNYWNRSCPDCEEKDTLIKELETRIKFLKILRRPLGKNK